MSLVMGDYSSTAPFFSSFSDPSTGYLEDALVEFGSKRPRLMLYGDDVDQVISRKRNSEEEAVVSFAEIKSRSLDHHQRSSNVHEAGPDGHGAIMRTRTRVAYPFALVKPGGTEGEVTLNEINRRIMMPPTRPVRHPVGDFACHPRISPGISGKVVVAFTTIQTPGRGTITIIRTKG